MRLPFDPESAPATRPLQFASTVELTTHFNTALRVANGALGAHCIHEWWMRDDMAANIEASLAALWKHAAASIPEWLPMRHISWLPLAYEVAAQFQTSKPGRANLYLVLLDYSDSRTEPYGIYVGMSQYAAAERFDQHKAGIRAAGSVLHRGLEVLTGPVLHLQRIKRSEAAHLEEHLAEALRGAGLFVKGGH